METITFDKDITVFYKTASSFPEGVLEAHQQVHALVPFSINRKYFGISRPENGKVIVYRAAAEELEPGEGIRLHCDTLVLKKGNYACITINDYMNNIPAIGNTFQQLISRTDIDPQGYCVEWYFNEKDLRCMVRLDQ
jgi:hypothetical protein